MQVSASGACLAGFLIGLAFLLQVPFYTCFPYLRMNLERYALDGKLSKIQRAGLSSINQCCICLDLHRDCGDFSSLDMLNALYVASKCKENATAALL